MIAENMRQTLDNMRRTLARDNGDYLERASFFLDSLEADVERVAALEDAAVCVDASYVESDVRLGVFNG